MLTGKVSRNLMHSLRRLRCNDHWILGNRIITESSKKLEHLKLKSNHNLSIFEEDIEAYVFLFQVKSF